MTRVSACRRGLENAGSVALGLQHLANRPKPAAVSGTNSDLAFQGDYAFAGNYNGINIYNVADPANPTLVTSIVCPGSQNDVSVWGNLLFVSVEATTAKKDCSTTPAADATTRFRGIRIFDISNINNPVQLNGVQTCRGSHTHTLVRPKNDPNNVYIYVSGTAGVRSNTEIATCDQSGSATAPNPSLWRIEVIKVPLAAPNTAAVVGEPRLFKNEETGAVNGLQNGPTQPQHPSGTNYSPTPNTNQCHDITVYEAHRPRGRRLLGQRPAHRHLRSGQPEAPRRRRRPELLVLARCDVQQRRQGRSSSPTSGAAAAARAAARPTSSAGARTRSTRSSTRSSSSAATTSCRSPRPRRRTASPTSAT